MSKADRIASPAERIREKTRAAMQTNARQERRKQERDIPLYYEPREVGTKIIQKVINAFNHDVPMISILRKVQVDRLKQGRRPLILADIYTILVAALHEGKVKERKLPASKELPLQSFRAMMKSWKQGELKQKCIEGIQPVPSLPFVNSLLRGVNKRVADRKVELKNSPKADMSTPESISAMEVLLHAVVRTMPDTRKALVIYLNDLTPQQLLFLRRVPSLESDMALEHKIRVPDDETLLPDEVVMSSIREMTAATDKHAPPPEKDPELPEVSSGNVAATYDDQVDPSPDVEEEDLDDEDDEYVFDEDDDDDNELDDDDDLDDYEWDEDEEWEDDEEEEDDDDLDDDDGEE